MKKIEYQCNICLKQRIMGLPENINFNVDTRGLMDIIDVHKCKGNKENAILLHVDSDLNVRTQIPVKKENDESSIPGLPLPSPQKVERSKIEIITDHLIRIRNIDYFQINDKIRNKIFVFDQTKKNDLDKIIIDDQFLEIQILTEKEVQKKQVKKWLTGIEEAYSKATYIDVKALELVLKFLDDKVTNEMNLSDKLALELIINSICSIPQTIKEDTEFGEIFNDLDTVESRNLASIIEKCKNNDKNNILLIYNELKYNFSFSEYIAILANLVEKGIINILTINFVDKK
ncbi:MAG: hypothetical protein K9W45_00935 [Candidatus Heimdallarchaeum aukensis]|uniref:Uncharacterized protein n=1 Tax=Candidatus Heimdallarchaeum aukensis TaxID=2876573 RepID=A0A9Y1BLE6_9ARCH|nr:MAG: hypothetical protein K9W45_00935 [Candidatus Heimdallarchaeum aukensis]